MKSEAPEFLRPYLAISVNRFLQQLLGQVEALYEKRGLKIPAAASSTLHCLSLREGASLAELAGHLGISHQLATQHVRGLIKLGIVTRHANPNDRRCQRLHLTSFGKTQADLLVRTMQEAQGVYEELYEEIGVHIPDLMEQGVAALSRAPLIERFPDLALAGEA